MDLQNLYKTRFVHSERKIFTWILLVFSSIYLLVFQRNIILLAMFAFLDLIISYIDLKVKIPLADAIVIGIIIMSYCGLFALSMLLIPLMLLSRLLIGKFEMRHIIKLPTLVIIGMLASALSAYSLIVVGISLYVLRYIMEYFLDFVFGVLTFKRVPRRIMQSVTAYLFFLSFGNLILGMLL